MHSGRREGNLTITTFNVQNLFDLVPEPGKRDSRMTPSAYQLEVKLQKLVRAVRFELHCPEILVVQEIDNEAVLQEIGNRINHVNGSSYRAVSFETSDTRSIEVGFLYDEARVGLFDCYQLTGPQVSRAFGCTSPSPGREPLVGLFDCHGLLVTVVGNHFKSKGGVAVYEEQRAAAEQATEDQRRDQAVVVRELANGILDRDPDALLAIAGDFNDFHYVQSMSEEIQPIAVIHGRAGEVPLRDVADLVPLDERYTFVYTGVGQVIDHIFVSPALLDLVVSVDILHFNAGFPRELAADPETAIRCSDHDPLEMRLLLPV